MGLYCGMDELPVVHKHLHIPLRVCDVRCLYLASWSVSAPSKAHFRMD